MRHAFILSALALGLASGRSVFAESRMAVGKISYVSGSVFRADKEDGPFRRLNEENDLFEGDYLKTETESRLEARLNDRSVIRLGSGSRMRLEKAHFAKKEETKTVSMKLAVGRMWAKVTKLFGESSFDVTTQNAVAGVRGTAFGVDAEADKSTTVRVYTGKVLISNKPVYMTEEPKKDGTSPGKKERREVPGPGEVSKKQWEESVAGALQQVKIASNGNMGGTESFAAADAEKDEWIAWNRARDKLLGGEE